MFGGSGYDRTTVERINAAALETPSPRMPIDDAPGLETAHKKEVDVRVHPNFGQDTESGDVRFSEHQNMKHCNLYSARKSRRVRILERCAKMRAAKERKRLTGAEVAVFEKIGRVVFGGPLFGDHVVEIVGRSDADGMVEIVVDGRPTCVKTQRGAKALLMRRIARAAAAVQ